MTLNEALLLLATERFSLPISFIGRKHLETAVGI